MQELQSVFEFLLKYCLSHGSSCPLVLVFLLGRLQSTGAQPVFRVVRQKVFMFLKLLDATGHKSLLQQLPGVLLFSDEEVSSSYNRSFSSHKLSLLQGLHCDNGFRLVDKNSSFVPFLLSSIWTIQQGFYQDSVLNAWETVPFQISSNPLVAGQYAAEVQKLLIHSYTQMDRTVCFVEIGAGHGILSFLLAKELLARRLRGTVICTDFHQTVFLQLLNLPWVRELCAKGVLDFAVCGAATATSTAAGVGVSSPVGLKLMYAGKNTLERTEKSDVLVVVGNYAFDSFPTELIVGTDTGELYQIGVAEANVLNALHTSRKRSRGSEVNGLLKGLCMRPICPLCACPLDSLAEVARKSCDACEAIEASDPVCTKTLLCRLLTNMTDIFTECKGDSRLKLPTGVHAVPVSATLMLQSIVSSFVAVQEVVLLAGDCFVSHDDARWQGDEFEVFASNFSRHTQLSAQCKNDHPRDLAIYVPFFDPPLVSPHASALAVPVSLYGLWAAFSEMTGKSPVEVMSTSLHMADFSVVKFRGGTAGHFVSGKRGDRRSAEGFIDFSLFGDFKININDFSTLRQLLMQDKEARGAVSLSALEELIVYSGFDLSIFLDLRFLIFSILFPGASSAETRTPLEKKRKLAENGERSDGCRQVGNWLWLCSRCVQSQYCTSWTEYICSMSLVNQWLVAISCQQSLRQCVMGFKDDSIACELTEEGLFNCCEDATLDSESTSNIPFLSSTMTPLPSGMLVLKLQLNCSVGQKVVFNIHSLQGSVLLAVCFKKLGLVRLSRLVAREVRGALGRREHGECGRPGIFTHERSSTPPGKHTLRNFSQLRKKLRSMST